MKPAGENWRSLGAIASDLVEMIEAKKRAAFKKECASDGVEKEAKEPADATIS